MLQFYHAHARIAPYVHASVIRSPPVAALGATGRGCCWIVLFDDVVKGGHRDDARDGKSWADRRVGRRFDQT